MAFLGPLFFLATQLFLTGGPVRQLLIGDRAQKSRRAPQGTQMFRERAQTFFQRVAIPPMTNAGKSLLVNVSMCSRTLPTLANNLQTHKKIR